MAPVVAQEMSWICPNVAKRSLAACARCVDDELCPIIGGTSYVCDAFERLCVHPDWQNDRSRVKTQCGVSERSPETWGATCALACTDNRSPFACSKSRCVNEDYPCRWVDNCYPPKGVSNMSSICMRPCIDHEDILQYQFNGQTCESAARSDGCVDSAKFCPVQCRTAECPWRCNRDEHPAESGQRCYHQIEAGTLDCVTAIKQGWDCNCKCRHIYFMLGGRYGNNAGGAFKLTDKVEDVSLVINWNATVGEKFSLPLPGQSMYDGDVNHAYGPRLKIVREGETCSVSPLPDLLKGLECARPPGADLLSVTTCTTAPAVATPWFQKWTDIEMGECGDFDICHCNGECAEDRTHWHRTGKLRVRPLSTEGAVGKAPPGCAQYTPTQAPGAATTVEAGRVERNVDNYIRAAITISGGLPPLDFVIEAIQATLTSSLAVQSQLLGKTVPELADVEVAVAARRRLREAPPRRLQACDDDPAAWKADGGLLDSCSALLATLGDKDQMCADVSMQGPLQTGCQRTCGICTGPSSADLAPAPAPGATTTTLAPALPPTTTTAAATTAMWPGGEDALKLRISVRARTDVTSEQLLAKLTHLVNNPEVYLRSLYTALEAYPEASAVQIPDTMWVHVHESPRRELPPEDDEDKGVQIFTTSFGIILIIVSALVGSCCLAVVAVVIWWMMTRDYSQREDVDITEEPDEPDSVTQSEWGYRFKRNKRNRRLPAKKPRVEKKDFWDACFERCLQPLWRKLTTKKLKKVDAAMFQEMTHNYASEPGQHTYAGEPGVGVVVGVTVQLCGLNQAHFNGLVGTILSGPNEKGRYEVDLSVIDSDVLVERKTLSFKPDNMRVMHVASVPYSQARYQDDGSRPQPYGNGTFDHAQDGLYDHAQDMPGQMPNSPLKQQAYSAGAEAWGAPAQPVGASATPVVSAGLQAGSFRAQRAARMG